MYRKLSFLFIGFAMVVIGTMLLLIDSASSSTFSGVFIIFPFVIFIGGQQSSLPLVPLVLLFVVMLIFLILPIILFKYTFNQISFESDIDYIICPNCGRSIPLSFNYCPFCGYNLNIRNDNFESDKWR